MNRFDSNLVYMMIDSIELYIVGVQNSSVSSVLGSSAVLRDAALRVLPSSEPPVEEIFPLS